LEGNGLGEDCVTGGFDAHRKQIALPKEDKTFCDCPIPSSQLLQHMLEFANTYAVFEDAHKMLTCKVMIQWNSLYICKGLETLSSSK
jgi:hypothetical protein